MAKSEPPPALPGTASVMVSFLGKPMPSAAAVPAADAAVLAEEAGLELPQADRARAAAATALPLSMDLLVIFFIVSLLLFR